MANTDLPNGLHPIQIYDAPARITHYPVAASQTIAKNDVLSIDTAGRIIIAVANSSTIFAGVSAQDSALAAADTDVMVYDDPEQIFSCNDDGTPGLAAPYTTRSSAACYDLKGTTGVFECNSAASSQDVFKVVGFGTDPFTGEPTTKSGINPRLLVKFNKAVHIYGTIA